MIDEFNDLKALANGVNPLTGELMENDSILNDPKIIRCLYNLYIKVIDMQSRLNILERQNELNEGKASIKNKTKSFKIAQNAITQLMPDNESLSLSRIIEKVNKLKMEGSKNLKNADIYPFLIDMGILIEDERTNGKKMKATQNAQKYGITNEEHRAFSGRVYDIIVYDSEGQKLVYSIIKDKFSINDNENINCEEDN